MTCWWLDDRLLLAAASILAYSVLLCSGSGGLNLKNWGALFLRRRQVGHRRFAGPSCWIAVARLLNECSVNQLAEHGRHHHHHHHWLTDWLTGWLTFFVRFNEQETSLITFFCSSQEEEEESRSNELKAGDCEKRETTTQSILNMMNWADEVCLSICCCCWSAQKTMG